MTLTIPFDPARLSLNARLCWQSRRKIAGIAKEAAIYAWHRAGCPVFRGPVRLSLLIRRGRRMDADNVVSGLKNCVDALVACGCLPGDSARLVRWAEEIRFETGKRWAMRPEVVLTVEEVA